MAQAQAVYERGEHARATNYCQQARARAEARGDAPGLAAHAGQPMRALYVLGMAEDMWGAIGREDKRAEVAALRARMRG